MFGCYVLRWLVQSRREPRLTRDQMVALFPHAYFSTPQICDPNYYPITIQKSSHRDFSFVIYKMLRM